MKRSNALISTIFLLCLSYALGGCAVYDVAVEERSAGEWVDDQKIELLIEQEFLKDDSIKFLDFDAFSYSGHVYIVGEYESRAQVDRAISIAKATEQVRTVTTYLLPKRAQDSCGTTDNLEIGATLRKDLIADEDIWSTNIDIEVVQCNVVLLGIVGSEKEKDSTIAHAKSLVGVREVKSFLTVR